ncbi:MAG: thiazole synthase [Brevinematales bacterium]
MDMDNLTIGGKTFNSRFFVGTGKLSSSALIPEIVAAAGCELITVALRRVDKSAGEKNILSYIPAGVTVMPNTSGARTADEAVRIARIARELGCGDFIKIEVIHEMQYLMPDNAETVRATEILAKEGFIVMPYILPDLVTMRALYDAGAATVMPLGSPIGSNRGLLARDFIKMIIENSKLPVVVDAGIGRPSHAAEAMEMGADAVLVNTAIAAAPDPVMISRAFSLAVQAGRMAFLSGLASEGKEGSASSPLTGFLG